MPPHEPYRDDPERLLDDDEVDAETTADLHVGSPSGDDEHGLPIPAWLKKHGKNQNWKWVPQRLRNAGKAVATWVKGPKPPVELEIVPYFPTIQEAPIKLLNR